MVAGTAGESAPADLRRAPPLIILILATMASTFALNVFMPSMPGIARYFGTDFATVQLTLTLFLVGVAFGQLLYGPISDRFGRRPVLLAGMVIYLVASIGAVFATSIEMLIAARMLQAVGACSGMVLARAMVRDVYARDRAASMLGYVTMAMAVAPAIAPAIGGQLEVWFGWRASFVLVAGFAVLLILLCLPLLHETHFDRIRRFDLTSMLASYASLVRSPLYAGYTLHVAFSAGAFFAFLGGAPYVVIELLGASPRDYGLYFLLVAGGYSVGSFVAGRLSQRVGVDGMILLGVGVALVGVGAMAALALAGYFTLAAIFFPVSLISIGNGISQPNGIAGAVSVNPRIAGAAAGLLGFLQMAMGGLLTVILGQILTDNQMPLIVIIAVSTLLALACQLWVLAQKRRADDR